MNQKELKNILSIQDLDFMYKGIDGSICPISSDLVSITYDGITSDFQSLDNALNAPLFQGKALNDICKDIEY